MESSERKIQQIAGNNRSITELKSYGLKILQPRDGYRFSVDALLLSDFSRIKKGSKVCDLGAGTGVISLIIAKRKPSCEIHAIEIQNSLFELLVENISINHAQNIIPHHLDIRKVKEEFPPGSFNHILSNPPFRPPDSGRLCLNSQEALSRHEILVTLPEILEAGRWLLRPGGRFSIIYPAERLVFLIRLMSEIGLEPKRLKCVFPKMGQKARLVLVEGVKDAGVELRIEPPLFLNEQSR